MEGYQVDDVISTEIVVNQEKIRKELICPICMGILRNPKECSKCETAFCEICLLKCLETNNRCPLKCSENIEMKERCHKIIRNSLCELKLHCPNRKWGCDEEVRYEIYLLHRKECKFQMTKCPAYDKCNTELPLTECEKHIKKCGYVLIQCEHCSKMIERRKIDIHVSKCDEIEIVCDWCEQVLKRKFYEHHINNKCKEYSIRCNRCNRTFKRRDEDMHDCIRHLTNCLKNANDEIKILKSQLQENKKFNEALLNEFAVIKILLSKKLKITPESMNYCQKFKQIKIVDNIKTYINETQYSLLDTPFCFDISFETRNLEDENLLWNAYFSEENKEDNKISLKSMVIKHRAGSVQIKLNVPPPEFEKINVEGIISNGCFVSLVCSLNDHILHEVRYYYDVMKSENSGLNEDEISILRTRSGIPFKTLSSKSVIIPKIELLRKILKRSDIETAYNYDCVSILKIETLLILKYLLIKLIKMNGLYTFIFLEKSSLELEFFWEGSSSSRKKFCLYLRLLPNPFLFQYFMSNNIHLHL